MGRLFQFVIIYFTTQILITSLKEFYFRHRLFLLPSVLVIIPFVTKKKSNKQNTSKEIYFNLQELHVYIFFYKKIFPFNTICNKKYFFVLMKY